MNYPNDRSDEPLTVRIPADVDREDRLLGPLTARQILLLVVVLAILYLLYRATRHAPPLVFVTIAVPLAGLGLGIVLGRREGMSMDRFAWAALRHFRSPHHLVAPTDADANAGPDVGGADQYAAPPLRLPVRELLTYRDVGVLDLGPQGVAVMAACSTVNFAMRTSSEQTAMVSAVARWLNAASGHLQILIRVGRVDLSQALADLDDAAAGLPSHALQAAAADHRDFLADLEESTELLARQVILVARQPLPPGGRTPAARPHDQVLAQAAEVAIRQLTQAADALVGADIVVQVLSAEEVTAVLASACDPAAAIRAERFAAPADVVTSDMAFDDVPLDDDADPGWDDEDDTWEGQQTGLRWPERTSAAEPDEPSLAMSGRLGTPPGPARRRGGA